MIELIIYFSFCFLFSIGSYFAILTENPDLLKVSFTLTPLDFKYGIPLFHTKEEAKGYLREVTHEKTQVLLNEYEEILNKLD